MAGMTVTVWTLLLGSCVTVAMSEVPCSQPCQNGGRCHKFLDRCTCVGYWVGQYCDTATACVSSPCFNGGTCESSVTTDFLCRCPDNVFGDRCEMTASHPCWSFPCQNGGSCVTTPEGYMCLCSNDFNGQKCEYSWKDPCISGPCQNGGSCTWPNGEDYVCKCLRGFDGRSCEKVPNTTVHHHPHSHGNLLSTSGGVVLLTILSLGGLFVLVGICYCCVPALRALYPPSSTEDQRHGSTTHPHVTSAAEELSSCSYQHGWKTASLAHGTTPLSGSVHGKSGAHAPAGYEGTYIVHAEKPYRKLRTCASVDEGGEKQGAKVKRPSTPPPTYDECVVAPPRV